MDQTRYHRLIHHWLLVCGAAVLLAAGLFYIPWVGLGAAPRVAQAAGPTIEPQGTICENRRIFLPLVGHQGIVASPASAAQPSEGDFVASVTTGEAGTLRGVYVPGVMALRVEQQPPLDPAYVSMKSGWATEYTSASRFGVTGLLAHNNLSGELFFDLQAEDLVTLVNGDGSTQRYQVTQVERFQALSAGSGYLDLDSGEEWSASELFQMMYTGDDHVTFQTCIENNGNPTWGRLFVVAVPVA